MFNEFKNFYLLVCSQNHKIKSLLKLVPMKIIEITVINEADVINKQLSLAGMWSLNLMTIISAHK